MRNFKSLLALPPLLPLFMTCVPIPAPAQTGNRIQNVLLITGASSEEDLDEQELERFEGFLAHPLEINLVSRSRLVSSGLLSQYQAASLLDYRSRYGDVLSFSELAAIEGFGQEFTAAIKPFVSLSSRSLPGVPASDSLKIRHDLSGRVAFKGESFHYGTKYKLSLGRIGEASMAARSYYGDERKFPPSSRSANITLYGKRILGKAIIGDYNLRLGQGLSLWSGMSLTGFSSSASFSRKPSGLSPSWSWSGIGSHRGVAADFQSGRFTAITFLSFPGLKERMAGGSLGFLAGNGQISLSFWRGSSAGKASGDFRWNIYGIDLFGEIAYDIVSGSTAGVVGASSLLGEGWRINGVARVYPSSFDSSFSGGVRSWTKTSDERGVAIGLERYGAALAADLAQKLSDRSRRQLKVFLKVPLQVTGKSVLTAKLTERYRPYEDKIMCKTGCRIDLDWSSAGISARYGEGDGDAWRARFRLESVLCKGLSGLTYLDCGHKTDRWSGYLRGTVFLVDNWDDRIYSYERDAPGNFTVPAYYGRGYSLSAAGGLKLRTARRKILRIYLRVSCVSYPFMAEPKPSATEAKLQALLAI